VQVEGHVEVVGDAPEVGLPPAGVRRNVRAQMERIGGYLDADGPDLLGDVATPHDQGATSALQARAKVP
jgi:hypothetical protein